MQYRVTTVLLLVTVLGVGLGWWLEKSRRPEMLYLHFYSNRYDINTMATDLPDPPRPFQTIASISFTPGAEFYFHLPNHYEPEMRIFGTVHAAGGVWMRPDFSIELSDVGLGYEHRQIQRMRINRMVSFYDGEFQFCISKLRDPDVGLKSLNPIKH